MARAKTDVQQLKDLRGSLELAKVAGGSPLLSTLNRARDISQDAITQQAADERLRLQTEAGLREQEKFNLQKQKIQRDLDKEAALDEVATQLLGVPEQKEVTNRVQTNAGELDRLRSQFSSDEKALFDPQVAASEAYTRRFNELISGQRIDPNRTDGSVQFDTSGPIPRKIGFDKLDVPTARFREEVVPGTNYKRYFDNITGEELAFDPTSFLGGSNPASSISSAPAQPSLGINVQAAHEQAIRDSGLDKLTETSGSLDKQYDDLQKLREQITGFKPKFEDKVQKKDRSADDILAEKINIIKDSNLPGSTKLEMVEKLKPKEMTTDQMLRLADITERKRHNTAVEDIRRKGLKNIGNKGSGSSNVASSLYDLVAKAGKDSDDALNVQKFITENRSIIDGLNKSQQKELISSLSAAYSDESGWRDVFDYFGEASPFRDIDPKSLLLPIANR